MEHQGRVADSVLAMLESLAAITDGFAVDQLTHCLQTATLAERAGADDEMVVASLCHDIGKADQRARTTRRSPPRSSSRTCATTCTRSSAPTRTSRGATTTTTSVATPTRATSTEGEPWFDARRAVRRRVGPDRVRPRLRHAARSSTSRPACARSSATPHSLLTAPDGRRRPRRSPTTGTARSRSSRIPTTSSTAPRARSRAGRARARPSSYLLVTRGEAGIDGMDPAEVGPRRVAEEHASAAVVGVDDGRVPRRPRRTASSSTGSPCATTSPARSAGTGPRCCSRSTTAIAGDRVRRSTTRTIATSVRRCSTRHVTPANRWLFTDLAGRRARAMGRRAPRRVQRVARSRPTRST